jgi:hypothetical protein
MPIYQYRKVSDQYTTHTLRLNPSQVNQELCTVAGVTYHFVEGELPEQTGITDLAEATVGQPLKATIRAHSSAIQRIDAQVVDLIRSRYSIDEELYLARIAIGSQAGLYTLEPGEGEAIQAFGDWAEECRQWGRAERAKFGL